MRDLLMNSDEPQEIPDGAEVTSTDSFAEPTILDEPHGDPPPRLGIIHLLAWLTVAAVLFGIENWLRNVENASGTRQGPLPTVYQGFSFASFSMMSAGVVGIVTLLRWRFRGRPQPLSPGHWILVCFASSCAIGYSLSTAWRMCSLAPRQRNFQIWNLT